MTLCNPPFFFSRGAIPIGLLVNRITAEHLGANPKTIYYIGDLLMHTSGMMFLVALINLFVNGIPTRNRIQIV